MIQKFCRLSEKRDHLAKRWRRYLLVVPGGQWKLRRNMESASRTPIFAIHREDHYGGIVGKAYSDLKEYVQLIQQLRREGGQFVKIMISGIMDFNRGGLTEESLPDGEIREMVILPMKKGFL